MKTITKPTGKGPTLAVTLTLGLWLLGLAGGAQAATCTSDPGAGNWATPAFWDCGGGPPPVVPGAGDDVIIPVGSTVTLNTNTANLGSLTVNGTLTIGSNNTARTMTVSGNIAVTGTMSVAVGSNTTHSLFAGGNITNTGTINLASDANSLCNVTFNRNGNQIVSGAGAYTFNRITLNMGATSANILDMQSAMATPANFLTITNGTYRHSNASAITPWTANTTIPATGGFWLNGAATVTANMDLTLNGGLLRISGGTLSMGATNARNITLNNNASTTFIMEGGALTTTGGIVSSATNADGVFTMTGGVISLTTITGRPTTQFLIGSATDFTMTGGTIFTRFPNTATYDINIQSLTQTVTGGGTIQLGDANAGAPNEFWLESGGTLNVGNLVVGVSVARTATLFSALSVVNDLTIGASNTLDVSATNYAVAVGGDWTNNGVFNARAGTVTLSGAADANIAGTSANSFYNLTVNKSGTGVTITNAVDHTVTNVLNLTDGIVITPATNVLVTTRNCNAGAVVRGTGWVAGSLRKRIPVSGGALACTFELGDTTVNYRPVDMTFASVSVAGSVTGRASLSGGDHPDTTNLTSGIDPAQSVNRFWTLTNNGTVFPSCNATFNYINPSDWDAPATPTTFIAALGTTCAGTDPARSCSAWSLPSTGAPGPSSTQTTATALAALGDFTVGELKLSGFSRERQLIYTRELY